MSNLGWAPYRPPVCHHITWSAQRPCLVRPAALLPPLGPHPRLGDYFFSFGKLTRNLFMILYDTLRLDCKMNQYSIPPSPKILPFCVWVCLSPALQGTFCCRVTVEIYFLHPDLKHHFRYYDPDNELNPEMHPFSCWQTFKVKKLKSRHCQLLQIDNRKYSQAKIYKITRNWIKRDTKEFRK